MNKDFSEKKLLSMSPEKQLKVLYDLALFIENSSHDPKSSHFNKLVKYHQFLRTTSNEKIQKLNKEFIKIKAIDYQFQVYLMNLERLLGQSKKDYDFLVQTGDNEKSGKKTFPIYCLLDSVRSAHNIGAIFRNAECFGVKKLFLCGLSPTPESIHVKKTSMGCDTALEWEYEKSAIDCILKLKKDGCHIYAVETSRNSVCLNELNQIGSPCVLVFGHEQFGISLEILELCDQIISIKLYGKKNSLNVGVSNAIVLNKVSELLN